MSYVPTGFTGEQESIILKGHELIERMEKHRRITTYATVAGALFALVRLTDIWIALKRRG